MPKIFFNVINSSHHNSSTFAGGAVATLGISAGTAYYTDNTASAGYSL